MHSQTTPIHQTSSPRCRLIVGVAGILLLLGCGSESDEKRATFNVESQEASWERQIDSVRGGVSSRLIINDATINEEQFRQLAKDCEGLEVLTLEHLDASPEAFSEVLPTLTSLRQLKLGSVIPTDAFPQLAQLKSLEILNLREARCRDQDLAALAALPRLKLLRLHSPLLTDAGLQALPQFPNLRYLHLIDLTMTDAGLIPVAECKELQSFYLDGGGCTDEGLSALLKQRPEVHFHWNELHLDDDPHAHHHDWP